MLYHSATWEALSRYIQHRLGTPFAVGCVQSWSGLSSLWVHWTTLMVISLVPECVIRLDLLALWRER